jgi:hypothetical protein
MKNRPTLKPYLRTLLVLAFLLTLHGAEGTLAWGEDWPMSSPVLPLRQTLSLKQRSALALASSNRMAALWAEDGIGAKIRFYDGDQWTDPPQLLTAEGTNTLWPTLAYSGTKVLAAWVEGGISESSIVVQMDVDTMHREEVMTNVRGSVAPRLAVGPDKAHMVFAHAANIIEADLYYTTRNLDEAAWAAPTQVITHGQVTPPGAGGKIFYPQIALSGDGQTVHVVWEQEHSSTRAVWHVAGAWSGGGITWGTPQQISPAGEHGTRPNLTVDAGDRVHIVWGRPTPNYVEPEGQTVFYKQLGAPGDPIPLNDIALRVNDKFPTLAELSIAASGPSLCAMWHGHYGAAGESDTEEIWMRCSSDGGASWQGGINVSTSPNEHSLFGNIQVDSSGSVYATWVEFQIKDNEKQPLSLNVRSGPSDLYKVFLPLIMRGSR